MEQKRSIEHFYPKIIFRGKLLKIARLRPAAIAIDNFVVLSDIQYFTQFTLHALHCMHYIAYITVHTYTFKLVVTDGPTDRQNDHPTDRPTDIVSYRAAIAAKNI